MELDHLQLWDRFKALIADNLPKEQYDSWFGPVSSVSYGEGRLIINVPSHFFVEQIEARYQSLVEAAVRKVYGQGTKLYYQYFQVADRPDTAVEMRSSCPSDAVNPRRNALLGHGTSAVVVNPRLNPAYTFENYCQGTSNHLARTIAESIADNPKARTFNPYFVFGPSGVGKTHLIQAIGIRIKEHNPDASVLYVTAREFVSQFTEYSHNGRINDFMHFYQSIEVLIVDDIQDLAGKTKTQNAFFHIFNQLVQNGRVLIMSADKRPAVMEGMEERLLSRFKQGMTVELERPDLELRRKVLQLKAENNGVQLPADVIDFIAANITHSVRELEGVIVSLTAHAMVLDSEINLELARSVVANSVKTGAKRQLNFEMVTDAVAAYYKVDPDMIFTKRRTRQVADARQMVMYLVRKHLHMPLQAIGLHLDRTHATVLHACNQTQERLEYDKQLRADLNAIEQSLL